MDVPNLTKEDLICLVSSSEAALREAIDKVRPNLKQTLSDKELHLVRRSMVNLRSKFMAHYATAGRNKPRLKQKHSSWLRTSVRVPICLLQDEDSANDTVPEPDKELSKCVNLPARVLEEGPNDSGHKTADKEQRKCVNPPICILQDYPNDSVSDQAKQIKKCANCLNKVNEDCTEHPTHERNLEKTQQAFQVVFEGLLKLKISTNLPELCSNCESVLLSLHLLYVDFLNLTETQSPVHILLRRSLFWKNRSQPDSILSLRLSAQPGHWRKSHKVIEKNQAKIEKRTQHQPEPLTAEETNLVELEDHFQDSEEPKAEVPLPVIVTQPAAAYIKQALYFDCLRCSTTFVGQDGFSKHRRSNHTIFPEPNYKIVPINNTQFPLMHMPDPTVAEDGIVEDRRLLAPSHLSTVVNIKAGDCVEQSLEKTGVKEVMELIPDNSIARNKIKAPNEIPKMKRKYTKEPMKFCSSSNRAENGRPKPNAAIVHGHKTRQSKRIVKRQRQSCPYCDEVIEGMKALDRHIRSHLPNLNVQQTNQESTCLPPVPPAHQLQTSEDVNSSSRCPECDLTFKNKRSYRHHLKWHKMQFSPDFPCPHCGDLLKGTKLLFRHIRLYHRTPEETYPQTDLLSVPKNPVSLLTEELLRLISKVT